MRVFFGLWVALTAMFSIYPGAAAEQVPLQESGGIYSLPVRLNDAITLSFVLDTGASDVSIPADVVSTLLRTGKLRQNDFIDRQTYVLADGSQLPSLRVRLREVTVGRYTVWGVVGSVSPVGATPLLGQSFLSRLPPWTIDYSQLALVITFAPSDIAMDVAEKMRLPPYGFYTYALDAGIDVRDRAALMRVAQCAKRTGWDIQQCGAASAKRAIAEGERRPPPNVDPEKICEPAQIGLDTLNKVACSVPRLAELLRRLYWHLFRADPRGIEERLRGHSLGDVRTTCKMIDWEAPQLPLSSAAENCVADYLQDVIRLNFKG